MMRSDQVQDDLKAVKVLPDVSIYKVRGSQYWYVRVWDSDRKKYIVKGTGETSRIEARKAAIDLARSITHSQEAVERQFTFRHFANKTLTKASRLVADGHRHVGTVKAIEWAIHNAEWGLLKWFGPKDVRKITTRDFTEFMDALAKRRPDLSSSSKNSVMSAFRNVLKVARDQGAIDDLPATPRAKQKDNPRPFFRFHPLVGKNEDAYRKLLQTARKMAEEGVKIRGIPVTYELYDVIVFLTQSFVRPVVSELYAIKHNDITVSKNPVGLSVVIRDGKTGYRVARTMPQAVSIYQAIRKRYSEASGEDYIFLPQYRNRITASQIIQRQFRALLVRADLETDNHTDKRHTLYSLRHTAICMRIVNSGARVNIFTLAKNAGTSVDQIERFYARHLPMSPELWHNLQSFGAE
jgi:integrase-like protein